MGHRGTLFFSARTTGTGFEPWKTDGTKSATRRLKDINPGPPNSAPGQFTGIGTNVFFTAQVGVNRELWRTDGSKAGTRRAKDINPGPTGSDIQGLTRLGKKLFFRADDGDHGVELWKRVP